MSPFRRCISIYRNLDPVWRDPKTGGKVFIGNKTAAHSKEILKANGIEAIVNCTQSISNRFEGDEDVEYYTFVIYRYMAELNPAKTHKGVLEFFLPVFKWIDAQLKRGRSVLIHCLAGAHRAGTTGTAYVMYAARMYDHMQAIRACQKCRPIVNPIHGLSGLLKQLGVGLNEANEAVRGKGE